MSGPRTPARDTRKLARRLCMVAPGVLAKFFTPDCCIAATRAAQLVYREFGVETVYPVPTSVVVLNPPYLARVEAGRPAKTLDEMIRLEHEDGSWAVAIGTGDILDTGTGRYDGHLVLGVPPYGLLDLSIGQASRPTRRIRLAAALAPVGRTFFADHEFHWSHNNHCAVGYRAKPAATDYRNAPDWYDLGRHRRVVEAIMRAL